MGDNLEHQVHCHDWGRIIAESSLEEEARSNRFRHVEVFDARRLLIAGGGNLKEEQAEELEDGYWLCPDCFHHMRETLLVVGGDFDKSSHRC